MFSSFSLPSAFCMRFAHFLSVQMLTQSAPSDGGFVTGAAVVVEGDGAGPGTDPGAVVVVEEEGVESPSPPSASQVHRSAGQKDGLWLQLVLHQSSVATLETAVQSFVVITMERVFFAFFFLFFVFFLFLFFVFFLFLFVFFCWFLFWFVFFLLRSFFAPFAFDDEAGAATADAG